MVELVINKFIFKLTIYQIMYFIDVSRIEHKKDCSALVLSHSSIVSQILNITCIQAFI